MTAIVSAEMNPETFLNSSKRQQTVRLKTQNCCNYMIYEGQL